MYHSRKLVALNPEQVSLSEVPGGGHNNLPEYGEYYEFLYDVLHDSFQAEPQVIAS